MTHFICNSLFIFIALLSRVVESDRILGVFPTGWKSHWKIGTSIVKQLANVGHDVTIISPFEFKEPNVQNVLLTNFPQGDDHRALKMQTIVILIKFLFPNFADPTKNIFDFEKMHVFLNFVILPDILEETVNFTMLHPNVQKLLHSDKKFDAVIVEMFHTEALFGNFYETLIFLKL